MQPTVYLVDRQRVIQRRLVALMLLSFGLMLAGILFLNDMSRFQPYVLSWPFQVDLILRFIVEGLIGTVLGAGAMLLFLALSP